MIRSTVPLLLSLQLRFDHHNAAHRRLIAQLAIGGSKDLSASLRIGLDFYRR